MSQALKTIVIGSSLSESSDEIVRAGVAVARATGASPWLVHVHSRPASLNELLEPVDGAWLRDASAALRARLTDQAQRTELSSLPRFDPAKIQVEVGSSYGEIVKLARRVKADLIVVGGSEGGAMHRLLIGSTADGVVRQASCPVLVVRRATCFPPVRVVLPVDLSPISANGLRQGMDLLAALGVKRAGMEALFVLNPLEVAGSLQFTPTQMEDLALSELHRFLRANGADFLTSQVLTGYPCEEIVAVLEETGADLVILGTHGRRGFEQFMVGSVALGVMHRAACNLLIVPPESRPRQGVEERPAQVGRAGREFVYEGQSMAE